MWLMTVTVFLIFFIGPGPALVARTLAGRQATLAQVAEVAHRLLLDRPWYVQYGHFVWLLLHGNLGYDYYHSQSVNSVIAQAFPITLALVTAATYTRLTRGSMLDVSGEDFIRTARSKGMSERRVIFRHNLRASLTPVVTQFGLDVGVLIGGAIITESVFSLPGLGYTAVQAINQQDLPVVIGVVIVASAGVIVANVLVDILYAVLDPRVRLH